MLMSLAKTAPESPVTADVAIVGAGLAGLFLADRLTQSGLRVVVLESGAETQTEDVHPLNTVDMLAQTYNGATQGRFRCLGGTSTRWGGALLPYLSDDLGPHPMGWHDGWHTSPDDLGAYLGDVEDSFGVQRGSYEDDDASVGQIASFSPRFPKWPAFGKRSTANLFREAVTSSQSLTVWLDATVTEVTLDGSTVTGVVAQSLAGHRLQVTAGHVVLASGAMETTRQLLLMNHAAGGHLFPADTPLGQGFHDHLSTPIADLNVTDQKAAARLFSFRFVTGGMRNMRFELGPETRADMGLPAAFLHVAFTRETESGFDGLRKIFQAVQQRRLPALSDIGQILMDAPWFMRAVWWRFAEQRVLPPTGSRFEMHLVSEQEPRPENRIALSTENFDPFGLPRATLDWSVSEADQANFWRLAEHTAACWKSSDLHPLAQAQLRDKETVLGALRDGGGIYHPAGTTRIGADASQGVVDTNLRVHGVQGLRALATSVFPSIGGSSPSLALTQFAVRMAQDISADLGKADLAA